MSDNALLNGRSCDSLGSDRWTGPFGLSFRQRFYCLMDLVSTFIRIRSFGLGPFHMARVDAVGEIRLKVDLLSPWAVLEVFELAEGFVAGHQPNERVIPVKGKIRCRVDPE